MTTPFEDPDGRYVVLVNEEKQYSLWPVFADVPVGWRVVREAGTYAASIGYVNENWIDMRPASLVKAMGEVPSDAGPARCGGSPDTEP